MMANNRVWSVRRSTLGAALAASLLILQMITGCGTPPPDPVSLPLPGYLGLREDYRNLDTSALRGRRIVLDPGHGGFFQGAVGQNGLTESSVNLGVALYLRGLLEWAGADVHLTRTADYDFLAGTDSTLAADLAFRVSFTDSLQPDVFLSIHHNSNASLDRTLNETQTYYPLRGDGASIDLARAIHRHLVLNLEIEPAKILPGNFHVLRNSTVPAVLGEPAMLSNPVIEGRLSLAASHELEAAAYFLGLVDYFSAGLPAWSGAALDTVQISETTGCPPLSWTFLADRPDSAHQAPGPDPATFTLTLDNQPQPWHLSADGRTLTWLPPDNLPPWPVVLSVSGRNRKGRATPLRQTLLLPAQSRQFEVDLILGQDSDALLRWRPTYAGPTQTGTWMLDDGTQISPVLQPNGDLLLSRQLALRLKDHLRFLPADPAFTAEPVTVTLDTLPSGWTWHRLSALPAGQSWRTRLPQQTQAKIPLDAHRPAIAHEYGTPVWLEAAGVLPMIDTRSLDPAAVGTIDASQRNWTTPTLVPDMIGKVIVLDPAGGGANTDFTGPLGLRGADLNLATAQWTARLLRGAGAAVHLTRNGETTLPPEDKVRLSGQVKADLFVTIGRTATACSLQVRHHPGSRVGIAWAEHFLSAASPLVPGHPDRAPTPAWDYLLRHTACPALSVALPRPLSLTDELTQDTPAWAQAEARALFLSMVHTLDRTPAPLPPLQVADLLADLPARAIPAADLVRVVVDGNFPWLPVPGPVCSSETPDNIDSFQSQLDFVNSQRDPGLPDGTGRHTLEIHSQTNWQMWLLEPMATGSQATLLLENR